jgi:hypothetical protein
LPGFALPRTVRVVRARLGNQGQEITVRTFRLFSAQTGSLFGTVQAASIHDAIDTFARRYGFQNRAAMWNAGRFEYIDAAVVS